MTLTAATSRLDDCYEFKFNVLLECKSLYIPGRGQGTFWGHFNKHERY